MGRRAKVRDNYTDDALQLRRLRDAVSKDTKRPEKWREKVINLLDDTIAELLQAP